YIPSTDVVISGNGQLTNPCPSGSVSSTFGYRTFDNSFHNGLDLAASSGAPTYAADSGTVLIAGWSDSAGNWVVIDHGNGMVTKYMHHSALAVTAGQSVSKGQQVGYVGSTGYSSGPHLHFQVEMNGSPVNPQIYL
ncbi:M23 family metallopeptidase, partial [Schaedlerella sp.]|uniref:M23 family metallopeptidase n=1 Tax=Schaedlerella sp. TaxID=2676057 RepID=UPI00374A08ED